MGLLASQVQDSGDRRKIEELNKKFKVVFLKKRGGEREEDVVNLDGSYAFFIQCPCGGSYL